MEGDAEGAQENTVDCENTETSLPPPCPCLPSPGSPGLLCQGTGEDSQSVCPTQPGLSQPSNCGAPMGSCGWRGCTARADGGCEKVTAPFLVNLECSCTVLQPTEPLRVREQRQLSSNCPWQDRASKVLSQSFPRHQGNFMGLSSPQCCNTVFMTHQFLLLFCHCFPSG